MKKCRFCGLVAPQHVQDNPNLLDVICPECATTRQFLEALFSLFNPADPAEAILAAYQPDPTKKPN